MKHKSKLFHFWFNTFFINEMQNCELTIVGQKSRRDWNSSFFLHCRIESMCVLIVQIYILIIAGPDGTVILNLSKHEIDGAHKDKSKIFPEDFRVSRSSSSSLATH